jgi:pyroglutamyl-peptidase
MTSERDVASKVRPARILVTGFSVFPGAPVNPTEALARILNDDPPQHRMIEDFRADVLAVEYSTIADRLSAIGRVFRPDIAIHFGLAAEARGFRLERVARNDNSRARPDQAGEVPSTMQICAAPDTLPSTLPLDVISRELSAAGLPWEWSDDAGGYLCNTVFTLSAAHVCDGFRPTMTGFVHVPRLKEAEPDRPNTMGINDLVKGARIIVDACVAGWENGNPQ